MAEMVFYFIERVPGITLPSMSKEILAEQSGSISLYTVQDKDNRQTFGVVLKALAGGRFVVEVMSHRGAGTRTLRQEVLLSVSGDKLSP